MTQLKANNCKSSETINTSYGLQEPKSSIYFNSKRTSIIRIDNCEDRLYINDKRRKAIFLYLFNMKIVLKSPMI